MTKVTLDDVGNLNTAGLTTINANSDTIVAAFDNTLSLDGTSPNQMAADLDMNHNDIINVDNLTMTGSLVIDGVTVLPEEVVIDNVVLETDTDASGFDFVVDEDDMASDSATKLPTQQSVKSYADTKAPLDTSISGTFPADSSPGGAYAGYAFNEWKITDTATVGATPAITNQAYGILVNYITGGSTLRGTRNAFSVYNSFTAPSKSESPVGQNYVAGQFIVQTSSDDNGTDTGSGAKGAFFAMNPVAQINSGATNLLHLSCAEWNMGATTGSSMRYKSMTNFANYPNDAVKGADVDAVMWFYSQGASAVGFDYGFLFSNAVGGTSGIQLIDTTGTIMATKDSGTAANGIDFSDWTFTGFTFRSSGFAVDGTGNINGHDLHALNTSGANLNVTTATLPTTNGNSLGKVRFGFQNQTTFTDRMSAYIEGAAAGAWTEGTSHPSILRFFATQASSTTPGEYMRIQPGSIGTGSTAIFLQVGTEGLLQVSVGANDSGGTGKRALTIANSA